MSEKHLDKVRFDFIRYSNCWEDADVLLEGLNLDAHSRVMSIASAGDNCFAMLAQSPQKVVAVDVSEVQLFLVELKREAIRLLARTEFLEFIGVTPSARRLEIYREIAPHLSEHCLNYWAANEHHVEQGIIHQGKFEQYFKLFKNKVLPTVHNRAIVDELFQSKTDEAQRIFHDEKWHTPEWEKMYRQFFGIEMMGTHGRDPEFLKHVEGSVPDLILAREMEHLRTAAAQRNYFLYYILYNKFNTDFLPFYLREENYTRIKENLDALVLHHGLLDSALEKHPNCTHFNLSDIFEYMDATLFKTVANELIQKSAPKTIFAYWNLMIPRLMAPIFPSKIEHLREESERLKKKDLGYFYGKLVFEQKLIPQV